MVEIELKLLLEDDEYEKVIKHFASEIENEIEQWNVFFAPIGEEARNTFRLRSETSPTKPIKWIFTVKVHGVIVDGVATNDEIEEEVSAEAAAQILAEPWTLFDRLPDRVRNEMKSVAGNGFYVVGDFRNTRRVIPYQGYKLECDESTLPTGFKYYEIEVETPDQVGARKMIKDLFEKLNMPVKVSSMGKYARLRRFCMGDERFSRKFPTRPA